MTKAKKAVKKAAPAKKRASQNKRITDPRKNPREWTLWVMAARDIILGDTQEDAATAISRSSRQLRKWMKHPAWADAVREAEDIALQGIKHHAIAAVNKSVKRGNATLGLEMMKLTMKQLQPVAKHEHEHKGSIDVRLTDAERAQKTAELLGRARARKAAS